MRITSETVVSELDKCYLPHFAPLLSKLVYDVSDNDIPASSTVAEPETHQSPQPDQHNIAPKIGPDSDISPKSLVQPNQDKMILSGLLLMTYHEHLNLGRDIKKKRHSCVSSGELCNVYWGTHKSTGVLCAIKKPVPSWMNEKELLDLVARYLDIWAKFSHANVIKLEGFVYLSNDPWADGIEHMAFVSSWQEHGTVLEYLATNPRCSIGRIVRDFITFYFMKANCHLLTRL